MTCRENQDRIVLFLYEELSDSEKSELETHLQECTGCNGTFEQQKELHQLLSEEPNPWDVPADLLVESRRSLANELDKLERKRSWWRLPAFSLVLSPMRLLEWATLVAVGLAAGVYFRGATPAAPLFSSNEPEAVSNLRIVNSDAATGNVEFVGDMVRPMHFQGNVQDERAQQLLFGALRDGNNASSRINAVEVLARKPDNMEVRDALIRALIADDNPGVRLKALQSLKPYANEDKDVRQAFMNVLANDDVAGIRLQAIEALRHFANDNTVARAVQEVTKDDDNDFIRAQAVQFVGNQQ